VVRIGTLAGPSIWLDAASAEQRYTRIAGPPTSLLDDPLHPGQPSIPRGLAYFGIFACFGIVVGFALLLNRVVLLLISRGG
jgi:hypothetical protein